jgi:geranylgeranyl diphosphate synthase type II
MNVSPAEKITAWRAGLEDALAALPSLYGDGSKSCTLPDATRYVLTGGGKRLRGLLTYSVWSDLASVRTGLDTAKPLAAAVAIEVLHAASLVHDDLPALDNDDMRRGKPSCHKAFGEATAILTADALFGAALLRITTDGALSSDEQARVSKIVSRAWLDLCIGQQLDINHQHTAHGASHLPEAHERVLMIQLKTGALFGAAAASGALCAGIRDAAVDEFRLWGVRVGECFQALDDLDDGDRKAEDRDGIHKECISVKEALQELHPRLASGVTRSLIDTILAS